MAYIKVLAIVLCSCFIQDALSGTSKKQVVGTQVTAAKNPNIMSAFDQVGKGLNQMVREVTQQLTMGVDKQQTKEVDKQQRKGVDKQQTKEVDKQQRERVDKQQTKRSTGKNSSRRSQRDLAATPPTPKYPYLENVQKMFWDMAEAVNADKKNGNKVIRAVRNYMAVKSDPAYWNALETAIRWYGKPTSNPIKAETRLRMCNAIVNTLTSPDVNEQFSGLTTVAINSMADIEAEPYMEALNKAKDVVDDGTAERALDEAQTDVESAVLNPVVVTKLFNQIKSLIAFSTMTKVDGGLADSLNKVGMAFENRKK